MRLELPGAPHLTYCTNIHPGETWSEIGAALRRHLPDIKKKVSPNRPMGVGLRLSGPAAAALGVDSELQGLQRFLRDAGLYVFTINAFPYGTFHGTRVKERVYEPDWRQPDRLRFTNRVADILARLLPDGISGSISTVPGAYKAKLAGPVDVEKITDGLLHHAAHLHGIAGATGKILALALEPEPSCFLETTTEAIDYFEEHLFSFGAIQAFSAITGATAQESEAALRRHLGICLDVCHAAVEFEEPAESVRRLQAAGIAVAKIQLSSALRLPNVNMRANELLAPFDDGVYLHQTVEERDGALTRYADLPAAFDALRDGRAGGEWRVHCHVPLFQAEYGVLQSTQDALADLLAACKRQTMSQHLEVETYTWSVLPADLRNSDVGSDIARELTWVRSQLGA